MTFKVIYTKHPKYFDHDASAIDVDVHDSNINNTIPAVLFRCSRLSPTSANGPMQRCRRRLSRTNLICLLLIGVL